MPDPIWLDTQTIALVADGDNALKGELQQLRNAGHQLLLPPKVTEELLVGNPFKAGAITALRPERRKALQETITSLGLQPDPLGARSDRLGSASSPGLVDRGWVEKGAASKRKFGIVFGESDSIVLSQVAASAKARGIKHPVIFTLDKPMLDKAKVWGVSVVTRNTPPATPPPLRPVEPVITPPSPSAEPRPVGTAEDILREGQKAIDDYVAKRGTGKGPVRGVASVGSMLFALVAVGSAVYVISKADNKLRSAEQLLAEFLIAELVVRAGGIAGLVASVFVFGVSSDSPEKNAELEEKERRRSIVIKFLRDRVPGAITYTPQKGVSRLLFWKPEEHIDPKAFQDAYDLLFNTPPIQLKPPPTWSPPPAGRVFVPPPPPPLIHRPIHGLNELPAGGWADRVLEQACVTRNRFWAQTSQRPLLKPAEPLLQPADYQRLHQVVTQQREQALRLSSGQLVGQASPDNTALAGAAGHFTGLAMQRLLQQHQQNQAALAAAAGHFTGQAAQLLLQQHQQNQAALAAAASRFLGQSVQRLLQQQHQQSQAAIAAAASYSTGQAVQRLLQQQQQQNHSAAHFVGQSVQQLLQRQHQQNHSAAHLVGQSAQQLLQQQHQQNQAPVAAVGYSTGQAVRRLMQQDIQRQLQLRKPCLEYINSRWLYHSPCFR